MIVKARGFVLVATIWVMAALSLFVAYFSVEIDRVQEQAFELKAGVQLNLDKQATLATVLYLASTRPMSSAGITVEPYTNTLKIKDPFKIERGSSSGNELHLDARNYRGIGVSEFSLQDAGSLLSLRGKSNKRIISFLEQLNVSSSTISTVLGRLEDYIDRDQFFNVNGAERSSYESDLVLAPSDRYLVSPGQIRNILDIGELLTRKQLDALIKESSIHLAQKQNYNTMTAAGMTTLGDMEEGAVQKIIKHRETSTFTQMSEVNEVAGSLLPYDILQTSLRPSQFMRMRLSGAGGRQPEWIGITLTPGSGWAPWQIDYRFSIEENPVLGSGNQPRNNNVSANPTLYPSVPKTPLFQRTL